MASYARSPTLGREKATTLIEPGAADEGHWVGAPSVHDYDGQRLLAVRERTPEERGRAIHVYREGDALETVRTIRAGDLGVESVERPALATDPRSGRLVVFVPVDHGSNQWTIRRLDGVTDPASLDPATARDVLRPRPNGSDSVTVKDPTVLTVGGRYYLFYAGHDGTSEQAHLATSVDGETFERVDENPVLGRQYWHDHHTRVSCVVPAPDAPVWQVFYEGSGSTDYGNTWNLRTGFATADSLRDVVDTTPNGPLYGAAHAGTATGVDEFATLRYLDVARGSDGYEAYYEVTREDGAFELRRAPLIYE